MRLHDYEQDSSGGNSHLAARALYRLQVFFFFFFVYTYHSNVRYDITTLAKLVTCVGA